MRQPSPGRRFSSLFALLLAVGLLLPVTSLAAPAAPGQGRPQPGQVGVTSVDRNQFSPPPKPRHRRLDSLLNRLVEQLAVRPAAAAAAQAPLAEGNAVAVSIAAIGDTAPLRAWLAGRGARVANVGVDVVEAYVPVSELAALGARPDVRRVTAIVPPRADVISQGAAVHGSPNWNANGFTGAGVKVGIIDGGFIGYGSLIPAELPTPAAVRCYTGVGAFSSDFADCQTGTDHGAAVAEALVDIAPQAQLYLANPVSALDLHATIDWMASQGVKVISRSMSNLWDGLGDGSSPDTSSPLGAVNKAVNGDIIWLNSAGNTGEAAWLGGYADADADEFLEFAPAIELNALQLQSPQSIVIQARWQDSWTNAARDIDLLVFRLVNNSPPQLVAFSDDEQSGAPGDRPFELISVTLPAGSYGIALNHFAGAAPGWLQVMAFTRQPLGVRTGGSVTNPGESANPGMLTVGAAAWSSTSTIEPYSAQGPMPDGRVKPDIVGADRGDSVTYGPNGFTGTSQSTPHLAGLAALVRQRYPNLSAVEVATYLKDNATPRGSGRPNNTWGYGLAALPAVDSPPPPPPPPPPGNTVGATTWYFAEGYTGPGFDEYLTIQNPNAAAAQITITYFLNGAPPVARNITVAGNSRYTVTVHDPAQGVGRNWQVSAKVEVTNGVGVVAERPMYFTYLGSITGGHNVMGVNAPRASWWFAEGYTGAGFDQYLTLMNPNPAPAPVTITYYLGGGQAPVVKGLTVPANSRYTVTVHDSAEGVGRGQEVSAKVETSHPGGIVAERPIYFRYGGSIPGTTGGHNVMGAAGPQPAWFFPDGATAPGWDMYLTLMNPAAQDSQVRLTYYVVGEATPRIKDIVAPRNARTTVAVHDATLGVGRGLLLGVKVETTNGVNLVAERPIYFRYSPSVNGGHDVMGAAAPATTWLFAEGYTGDGFDEYLTILNPNATAANVTVTYYLNGGGGPIARTLTVGPYSRATVAVHDVGQVGRGREVSAKVESTNGVGVVAERPMYFVYGAATDGGHTVMGFAP
jgi:hypothetical protein